MNLKVLQYQVEYADGTQSEPQVFTKTSTNPISRRLTADLDRLFLVSQETRRVVAITIREFPKP